MYGRCTTTNCGKKITNNKYRCQICDTKFCCSNCLSSHSSNCEISDYPVQRTLLKNKPNSSNFKQGIYLKIVEDDPKYDFQNFEYIKYKGSNKIISSGLYGDSFLAINKYDKKQYTIKQVLKVNLNENGVNEETVNNEINIHRRLIHENIIRLYSSYENDEAFYLVHDFFENNQLYQVIKEKKRLTESEAFNLFIQLISAVNFLHENNIVHRDIKPENIILDKNNNLYLTDFSLCAELSFGNRITFCGTPEYMAPEIMKESPYNQSVDVWSLGILLFELTQGFSPFRASIPKEDGSDYNEIYKNVMKNELKFEKPISKNCQDLIRKMLEIDRHLRIKIKEILQHNWILENYGKQPENDLNIRIDCSPLKTKSIDLNEDFEQSIFDKVLNKVQSKNRRKKNSNEFPLSLNQFLTRDPELVTNKKIDNEHNRTELKPEITEVHFKKRVNKYLITHENLPKNRLLNKSDNKSEDLSGTRASDKLSLKCIKTTLPIEGNKSATGCNPLKSRVNFDLEKPKKEEKVRKSSHFLAAIDVLEKSQKNKNEVKPQKQESSFWSFLNAFQCGK